MADSTDTNTGAWAPWLAVVGAALGIAGVVLREHDKKHPQGNPTHLTGSMPFDGHMEHHHHHGRERGLAIFGLAIGERELGSGHGHAMPDENPARKNKYVVVKSGSTHGPYIVEKNHDAPKRLQWSKAHIAGYADTIKDAEALARKANA